MENTSMNGMVVIHDLNFSFAVEMCLEDNRPVILFYDKATIRLLSIMKRFILTYWTDQNLRFLLNYHIDSFKWISSGSEGQ
jgi:hypothetical protein